MSPSQSLRRQAHDLETLARQNTMGTERVRLSQDAKRLHQAADQAELAEAQALAGRTEATGATTQPH